MTSGRWKAAPNDEAILRQFVRLSASGDDIVLHIRVITWHGPHTPQASWQEVRRLARTAKYLKRLRRDALANRRYFAVCHTCRERNPKGWMWRSSTCNRCAERFYGIRY
ncbi:hypothetical protein [Deinococcus sp.]|uniref:hypothetical protein n=1 Tax=Deinococcus sp. TaxID=47478 RepID=UPI003B58D55B